MLSTLLTGPPINGIFLADWRGLTCVSVGRSNLRLVPSANGHTGVYRAWLRIPETRYWDCQCLVVGEISNSKLDLRSSNRLARSSRMRYDMVHIVYTTES